MTKNLFIQSVEGKKIGQIQRRISRGLVLSSTIKQVVISLQTKYEHSSLHCCLEIFDEKFHSTKYGRRENWQIQRKTRAPQAGQYTPVAQ